MPPDDYGKDQDMPQQPRQQSALALIVLGMLLVLVASIVMLLSGSRIGWVLLAMLVVMIPAAAVLWRQGGLRGP